MLSFNPVVFAYFSPEALLPLTSVIASAVGVFLLFGSTVLRLTRRALRIVTVRSRPVRTIPRPHFHRGEASVEAVESLEQPTPVDSDLAENRPSGRGSA